MPPPPPFTLLLHGQLEEIGQAACARWTRVCGGSPTGGAPWLLQSLAAYIQLRPPLVDTLDWKQPLTFLLRGDADP